MSTVRVRASDYEWFEVVFDDAGKAVQVTRHQVVWSGGRIIAQSVMMGRRIERVIEQAWEERRG